MQGSKFVRLLAGISAFLLQSAAEPSSEVLDRASQNGLAYLGTIEGKHFFAQNPTTGMSWMEASGLCYTASMRLATITSVAQANLIQSETQKYPDILKWSWIAGREAQELFKFAWEYEPTTPITSNLTFTNYVAAQYSCLALYHGDTGVQLQGYQWSAPFGCICEVLVESLPS